MPTRTVPLDRFWAKVNPDGQLQVPPPQATALGPCQLWARSTDEGYGTFWADGARQYAHHWLWVTTFGPLPAGKYPDHRCHSYQWCAGGRTCPHRACVNLRHLQLASARVNVIRGCGPGGVNARKRACDHGHPLTVANVYIHPRRGTRHCRLCQALRNAHHYAALRQRPISPGQLALTF